MARQRRDHDIDALIDEITVDCYGDDEELSAFAQVFEERASLPCPGTVVGERVEVLAVALVPGRRELVATCQRGPRRYRIALLDIEIQADPATERLLAAYRRWAAGT
ncbi:MAG TPA: hypothetical protein VMB72_10905 [Acidimicrobiales bacterium]|nr:hypothetical protein [Acidimicrobiales bacterium]